MVRGVEREKLGTASCEDGDVTLAQLSRTPTPKPSVSISLSLCLLSTISKACISFVLFFCGLCNLL